jgi:hypothetical protein
MELRRREAPSFVETREPMLVQTLVTDFAVHALGESVLVRLAIT